MGNTDCISMEESYRGVLGLKCHATGGYEKLKMSSRGGKAVAERQTQRRSISGSSVSPAIDWCILLTSSCPSFTTYRHPFWVCVCARVCDTGWKSFQESFQNFCLHIFKGQDRDLPYSLLLTQQAFKQELNFFILHRTVSFSFSIYN